MTELALFGTDLFGEAIKPKASGPVAERFTLDRQGALSSKHGAIARRLVEGRPTRAPLDGKAKMGRSWSRHSGRRQLGERRGNRRGGWTHGWRRRGARCRGRLRSALLLGRELLNFESRWFFQQVHAAARKLRRELALALDDRDHVDARARDRDDSGRRMRHRLVDPGAAQ